MYINHAYPFVSAATEAKGGDRATVVFAQAGPERQTAVRSASPETCIRERACITGVHCTAHARRDMTEAQKKDSKKRVTKGCTHTHSVVQDLHYEAAETNTRERAEFSRLQSDRPPLPIHGLPAYNPLFRKTSLTGSPSSVIRP